MARRAENPVTAALRKELRGRPDITVSARALLEALAGLVDHAGRQAHLDPSEPRVLHAGADAARVYLQARRDLGLDGPATTSDPFEAFLESISRPTPSSSDSPQP